MDLFIVGRDRELQEVITVVMAHWDDPTCVKVNYTTPSMLCYQGVCRRTLPAESAVSEGFGNDQLADRVNQNSAPTNA